MKDLVYAYHMSLLDVPDTKKARVRAVEEFVNNALVTGSSLDYYAALAIQLETYAGFGMRRKCEHIAEKLVRFNIEPEKNVFPWIGRVMLEAFHNHRFVLGQTRLLLSQEYPLGSDIYWLVAHLRMLEAECLIKLERLRELSTCMSEISKLANVSWAGPLSTSLVDMVPDTILYEDAPRLMEKMLAEGTSYSLETMNESLRDRLQGLIGATTR